MGNIDMPQANWEKVVDVLNGVLPESALIYAGERTLLNQLREVSHGVSAYEDLDVDVEGALHMLRKRMPDAIMLDPWWKNVKSVAALAAACVAIVLTVWLYFVPSVFNLSKGDKPGLLSAGNIKPGKNTATMTLGSGEVIKLSDAQSVVIVSEQVTYSDNSPVFNESNRSSVDSHLAGLSVATPRGGTYQVVLPDGTRAWLNAESRINFPAQFKGAKREISMAGEIYLEVAHDRSRPFIVHTGSQVLEVLGTHFNINSYPEDAAVKTTLLEGSIRVFSAELGQSLLKKPVILKPGQQLVLSSARIELKNVNTDLAVAWKSNSFTFERQTIKEIMPMISRWYNVNVVYRGVPPKERFWGSVSRFENMSKVLEMLEETEKVRFQVEGRTVYVSKVNN